MKIILRILTILFVAALIAGAFTLIVNHSTTGLGDESGRPTDASGQTRQLPSRPEDGSHDDGGAFGLLEILATLGKLTGITLLVLLSEKAVVALGKRAPRPTTV